MLICNKCGKEIEEFYHGFKCFECYKTYQKEYKLKNKDKLKEQNKKYRETPSRKEKAAKYMVLYQIANKKKRNDYSSNYYYKNRGVLLERQKEYLKKNKDKFREKNKLRQRRKIKDNINYKLSSNIRCRINNALRMNNIIRNNKSNVLLGCTINELKEHLEKQFTNGMNWNNWGKFGWHIDHIIPCASFDLTKESEQLKCFHYSNLQPLWATDNLSKGRKIINYKLL